MWGVGIVKGGEQGVPFATLPPWGAAREGSRENLPDWAVLGALQLVPRGGPWSPSWQVWEFGGGRFGWGNLDAANES